MAGANAREVGSRTLRLNVPASNKNSFEVHSGPLKARELSRRRRLLGVAARLGCLFAAATGARGQACAGQLHALSCATEFEGLADDVYHLKMLLLNASYNAAFRAPPSGVVSQGPAWRFAILQPFNNLADLTVDTSEEAVKAGHARRRRRHRRHQQHRGLPEDGGAEAAAAGVQLAGQQEEGHITPIVLVPPTLNRRAQAVCSEDPACCHVSDAMELAAFQHRCLGGEKRPVLIHVPNTVTCEVAGLIEGSESLGATVAFMTAGLNLEGWPFVSPRGDLSKEPPNSPMRRLARSGACAMAIVRQPGVRLWFVTQHRRDLQPLYFAGQEKVRHLPLGIGSVGASGGLLETNMFGRIRVKLAALAEARTPAVSGSSGGGGGGGCEMAVQEGGKGELRGGGTLELLSASFSRFSEPLTHRDNTSAALEHTFAPHLQVGTAPFMDVDALLDSLFVVSPRAMGADTFQHWIALAFGAIPLVDSDPTLLQEGRLLTGLPALPVKSWSHVTCLHLKNAVEEVLRRLGEGAYRYEKLTMDYWTRSVEDALVWAGVGPG